MSLVNPDVIGYLNEYIMRVHMNNEDPKKVISEMLQQGKFRKYERYVLIRHVVHHQPTNINITKFCALVVGDSLSLVDLPCVQIKECDEACAVACD